MKGKFKILTLILVCVVCFGCFACASNKEDTKKETKKKVETVEDKEEKIEDKEDAKEEAKEEAKAEKKEAKTLAKAKGNKQNNTTASKPSASKPSGSASKPNNSTSKPATSKPSGSTSKPSGSTSKPSQPSKPAHTHSWVEQTKTVTTKEQGHYEPKVEHHSFICNGCGKDFGNNGTAMEDHAFAMMEKGDNSHSWHDDDVVVGQTWVVDVPASSKVVVTGYKCSGCGATK